MARYWKPSKARIKRDIQASIEHSKEVELERNHVIGLDTPQEYREQVINAACLMLQARDSLTLAKSFKPSHGEPWESEGAVRSFKYYKQESDDLYEQYTEAKSRIIAEWPYDAETVTTHIKAAYSVAI